LSRHANGEPLRVLETGAGTGAMLERMLDAVMLQKASYLGVDTQIGNITTARRCLPDWGRENGFEVEGLPQGGMRFVRAGQEVDVFIKAQDALLAAEDPAEYSQWDLLVAHAFLDLLDMPASLPGLLRLLKPGGLFYFTINFDGDTIFEPEIDPRLDEQILSLYHRSMDERFTGGKRSGDSRAGRHLFGILRGCGAQILEAGASDWVVFAGPDGYPADEAYFLNTILHFFEESLSGHPELDGPRFAAWLDKRRAQIDCGELVYIAHQLDFAGRM
jgi:SAM-dependent methyltransferase